MVLPFLADALGSSVGMVLMEDLFGSYITGKGSKEDRNGKD